MKFALIVSPVISLSLGGICFFIKCKELETAYGVTLDTLSVFSLTFLGFIVTCFTVLQIVQAKDWFEKIKTTAAFEELLNEFKLLIIFSACGIFVSLFLRVIVSLLTQRYFLIAGICLASFIIAFLCSLAWKAVLAIIVLFKV